MKRTVKVLLFVTLAAGVFAQSNSSVGLRVQQTTGGKDVLANLPKVIENGKNEIVTGVTKVGKTGQLECAISLKSTPERPNVAARTIGRPTFDGDTCTWLMLVGVPPADNVEKVAALSAQAMGVKSKTTAKSAIWVYNVATTRMALQNCYGGGCGDAFGTYATVIWYTDITFSSPDIPLYFEADRFGSLLSGETSFTPGYGLIWASGDERIAYSGTLLGCPGWEYVQGEAQAWVSGSGMIPSYTGVVFLDYTTCDPGFSQFYDTYFGH